MKIKEFLDQTDLERCLIVGYYGGGNFGDELLLEVLQNQLASRRVRRVRYIYSQPDLYPTYHHDFGYQAVSGQANLAQAVLSSRSLIVGGGGLWGMDVNFKVFIMSATLFVARYLLGKRVYLIGVGYYGSTGRLGRISAWLAGKAANLIIARDTETATNFRRLNHNVSVDRDIAFLIEDMDLSAYEDEAAGIGDAITQDPPYVYIAIRKYRGAAGDRYNAALEQLISGNQDVHFILSLLQPKAEFPEGEAFLESIAKQRSNVQMISTDINPLALVYFFKNNASRFAFITPQFHAIITAIVCGIPYAAITYDNKVTELLSRQGDEEIVPLAEIDLEILQRFVDHTVRSDK